MPHITLYPALIRDALKSVRYPGEESDIVTSGMVEDNIRIEENKVSLSIRFKKSRDPFHKSVLRAAEEALKREISPELEVEITPLVPEPTPTADEEPPLQGVKNIIAIASGKGGVGKSTVTTNLAVSLAALGYSVGLLDADIFGPSIPRMLGVQEYRPWLDEVDGKELIHPAEAYGVKALSIGHFVDSDQALAWRGSMASNALGQLIREGNWGELDYLLLDLPPGTSDIQLTLVQTLPITGAIIVTTPQSVATDDAIKAINLFRLDQVSVPILGVVENMSWFTPAELPDHKYRIFGEGGGEALAELTGSTLLGQIPLVQSVREGGDEGKPVALRETVSGLAFRHVAEQMIGAVEERNRLLPPTHQVKVNK